MYAALEHAAFMDIPFDQVGRLPAEGDNVAIASRHLEAGTRIHFGTQTFTLPHTILEGHRFAIVPIHPTQALLSWGLPFGHASKEIAPGDYACNAKILYALSQRHVDFALPQRPNFEDHHARYRLDESRFRPGQQVPRHASARFFQGYDRGAKRGVGTRNYIVVLGTTSSTGSFARLLADRFKDVSGRLPGIDGVVAIAHTEGAGTSRPNNLDLTFRTLSGFLVHPNVGAVLALDIGNEPVTNLLLQSHLTEHRYPIDDVLHRFLSIGSDYRAALAEGEAVIRSWLEPVNAFRRTQQSLAHIRIGLQCGGSDAFSGVSGNPLVGWMSKELLRYGGSANLAETDELIGAEPYVLQNVRDLEIARSFLDKLDRFQERASWHGHDAEGNPSGGNNFRGLYNIAVKSIGAARKKDPEVRLDYVTDYGAPMTDPGFYFMDSPGNDLESIAGQVAAGCNLILFTTGNGSITNFPFVPTIKVMTNTGRFRMLTQEMDINAGRYMDGTSMEELGSESFELMARIVSGERSAGEKAGHSQAQLWREWRQTSTRDLERIRNIPKPSGNPIPLKNSPDKNHFPAFRRTVLEASDGHFSRSVGLILPTSLCSGQIGRMIAEKLNREDQCTGLRYAALAHTEGCGASGGDNEETHLRTMAGYLMHPMVRKGLLLEHGCEKTHNDAVQNFLADHGLKGRAVGRASIQLDGGVDSVTRKVASWFQAEMPAEKVSIREAGLESVRLALTAVGEVPDSVGAAFSLLSRAIVEAGGTVVVPQNSPLLQSKPFVEPLFEAREPSPSILYGAPFQRQGMHLMETPTDHFVETLTGLGATGVEVMLAYTEQVLQSNPMIPLIQAGSSARPASPALDIVLDPERSTAESIAEQSLEMIGQVLSQKYLPKMFSQGNVDFQMTRGLLGVSL